MLLDESFKNSVHRDRFPHAQPSCQCFKQASKKVALCGFSEGFSDTVISIQAKVAAHFTELSAPLMVHHDLLFPSMSLQQSVCHLTDSDGVDEQETQRGRCTDRTFPWLLHTNKVVER